MERLVLNCIQRMSGIASLTNRYKKMISKTNCKLLDTRKTTPNFRYSILKLNLNKPINERSSMYEEFESILGLDEERLGLNNILKSINIAKENQNIKGIELKCDFPLAGWAQTMLIY